MSRLGLATLLLCSIARADSPEAEALVSRWIAAQNTGDFAAYTTCYATDFQGVRRSGQKVVQLDREGWLRDRERMFKKKMLVSAGELRFDGMEVTLRQRFEQGTYRDVGMKKLLLVREGGLLRIAREEMLSSEKLPAAARVLIADPISNMKDGDPPPRASLSAGYLDASQAAKVSLELRVAFREGMPKDWQKCQFVRVRAGDAEEPLAADHTASAPDGWAVRVRFESPEPIERFGVNCPGGPSVPPAAFGLSAPPNAWLVAIELGSDPAAAKEAFDKLESLPTHNGWPHLLGGEWILGARLTGFVAAIAAADDEKVARALAKALEKSGIEGVVVRRAWWPEPEPLRLVVVNSVDDKNGVYSMLEYAGAFILQEGPSAARHGVRARTRAGRLDNMLVLPYTLGAGLKESFQLVIEGARADCKSTYLSAPDLLQKPIVTVKSVRTRCVEGS